MLRSTLTWCSELRDSSIPLAPSVFLPPSQETFIFSPRAGRADSYTNKKYSFKLITEWLSHLMWTVVNRSPKPGVVRAHKIWILKILPLLIHWKEERKGGRGEVDHNSVHEACKHLEFLVGVTWVSLWLALWNVYSYLWISKGVCYLLRDKSQ